jgi:glycosyltransferase involved in cell wall biosynthesis
VGGLSLNVAEGFNGYLVPSGDAEALADKVTLLLKYEGLREQLGEQAMRWAERFSWGVIADEILEVYHRALALAAASCGWRPPELAAGLRGEERRP